MGGLGLSKGKKSYRRQLLLAKANFNFGKKDT
jgi:hypothetical protein